MIPYLRCDVCGRATSTSNGDVRPLEVCRDVERDQDLCFFCYQGAETASRPDRQTALRMRREKK